MNLGILWSDRTLRRPRSREAMKQNHVLIDYENVQPEVAQALAQQIFKVWVFVGAQQAKVKFDLVDLVQLKGQDARSSS